MRLAIVPVLPLLALPAILIAPGSARAGIPVIYGTGDKIDKVADLPADHPARGPMGQDAALGYKYWHFHIYYCPLWTSGGEFVIYGGDQFVPLGNDAAEVSEQSGVPAERVRRPFFSMVPFGWVIGLGGFGGLVILGMVGTYFSDEGRVKRLMKRPEYQEALAEAVREPDPVKGFERGVAYLVGRGVPPEKAHEELSMMLHTLAPRSDAEAVPQTSDRPVGPDEVPGPQA